MNENSKFIDKPIEVFCKEHGINLEKLEQSIFNFLEKAGKTKGTAVKVLEDLINLFDSYGARIPYAFGGGHNRTQSFPKVFSEEISTEYELLKINRYIGSENDTVHPDGTPYPHYGIDSSGLVVFILNLVGILYDGNTSDMKNGNVEKGISSLGRNKELNTQSLPEKGDLIFTKAICRFVLSVDKKKAKITVAESTGGAIGVIIKTYTVEKLLRIDPNACYSDMSNVFTD